MTVQCPLQWHAGSETLVHTQSRMLFECMNDLSIILQIVRFTTIDVSIRLLGYLVLVEHFFSVELSPTIIIAPYFVRIRQIFDILVQQETIVLNRYRRYWAAKATVSAVIAFNEAPTPNTLLAQIASFSQSSLSC